MASDMDFPAQGKVIGSKDEMVVFAPSGTSYELHLVAEDGALAPGDRLVDVHIRVRARKLWTVPSGGLFLVPIFGPPRIVQGRVLWLSRERLIVRAGTNLLIDLPADDAAYDLANGPIAPGVLVNVTCLPGASIAPVAAAQLRA